MTEFLEENQKCPHCGSEEVEKFAAVDKAKFHEEVKAKWDDIIPLLPEKMRSGFYLIIPLVIICVEAINFFVPLPKVFPWHSDLLFFPWHSDFLFFPWHSGYFVIFVVFNIPMCFLSSWRYNNLQYPIDYSNWHNSYICYRCGKSFICKPPDSPLPAYWFIRKNKLAKLLALYSFALITIRFMGVFMSSLRNSYLSTLGGVLRTVSMTDGLLLRYFLRQDIFSMEQFATMSEFSMVHILFYMIPIAGALWLLTKRQSGVALIFAGAIGFVGLLEHTCSSAIFILSIFKGDFGPFNSVLPLTLTLALVLTLGFAFMGYKIHNISESLYKNNFHTSNLKIASTVLLFVFCYALSLLYH